MRGKLFLISLPIVLAACDAQACGSKLAAAAFAKSAVKETLKAPDTADFASVQAHPDGECIYLVAGRVSAQNGFGAQIQNTFSVMVEFEQGSNDYRVYDLLLTE